MEHYLNEYDVTDARSIEQYGKKLIGRTFNDVVKIYNAQNIEVHEEAYENKKRKGGLGELIEEYHFHYKPNNDSRPDFAEAGVELKVTPYKKNRSGKLAAKERLIITMIDYMNVINESFEASHLWAKAQLILLVYYLYEKEIENRLDYRIDYATLFTPPEQDIQIIKRDFEIIRQKIREGKAHELSEGDTLYLGAAPKAATAKDRRKQPNSEELAKPRAFAFKNSYMTYVLNQYVVPDRVTYEPIIKEGVVDLFEEYITNKINVYKGYSIQQLIEEFNLDYNKDTKNLGALLAYRILGIKGNKAAEFEKANIVVKTIRIEDNNKIKQHMSFPAFKFKQLIKETWDESTFGTYLSETRFFFVIYKFDKEGVLRLKGCQFWNMPYNDLNEEVYKVWEETRQVLVDGLKVTIKNGKKYNNFPGSSKNQVCHVRPHGKDSSDVDELPDGRMYPKQCFWLNNSYILSQLSTEFLQ